MGGKGDQGPDFEKNQSIEIYRYLSLNNVRFAVMQNGQGFFSKSE